MAVRVKLSVIYRDKEIHVIALVNSGFETDTPQLLLPEATAERLGVSPPSGALELTYDTAGGPTKVWVYPKKIKVKILAKGAFSKKVSADLAVSPIEDEVLISDKLAGELKIVVEDFGKGVWRLRGEKKLRRTEKRQIWK